MEKTYRSALFYGPKDVRIENLPLPSPASGEMLVRIGAATTCGTDFKTFERGHPVIIKKIPSPFGHEMAGTVTELGSGVSQFQKGDRVVIANSAPCGLCAFCKMNKPNLCLDLEFVNGGFAEYLLVPARIVEKNTLKIPDSLPFEKAALTEPIACVLHALELMQVVADENVAIMGTGPMSFIFLEILKARHAKTIICGRNAEKLAHAKAQGASHTVLLSAGDPVQNIKKITNDLGADVVFDATGQASIWELAVNLVRRGGRVCFYGGCARGTTVTLDTYRLHYEEITFSGVFHHTPTTIRQALTLISEGKINTDLFTRETRSLDQLPQILSRNDPADALKYVIITPQN